MVRKLRKLPTSTQQVLQLAACVGNTFDLHTLSIIHETSAAVAYRKLLPAIQEGLVLPISELEITPEQIIDAPLIILSFKFLHDRVQQAAYATIPEEHKKEVHLKIGQLLLKNTTEELEEKVFDLVNHLNIGVELIDDLEQKVKLSNLNLIAGKKAKASTAYKTAATYFGLGIKLLGIQAWENYYELTFTLYRERSECEYLAGNLEEAEELFKIALSNSQSAIDKSEIYSLYTFFCSTLSRKDEALKFTLAGLECLGMDLPRTEEELPKTVESRITTGIVKSVPKKSC
jgi:predicted ATPase